MSDEITFSGDRASASSPPEPALQLLARANSERFVSVDPNIRPTVEPEMDVWRMRLDALLPHADLVKISAEDLALLRPGLSAEAFAAELTALGVGLVVVTDGGEAAHGWTATGLHASAVPPEVCVVDTVGAGDTFQAAMLTWLEKHDALQAADASALDSDDLRAMLSFGTRAAAITCGRRGADLPRLAELGPIS